MNAPLIFDIQRFSLHDGRGIRTTVFFKGCPLHCLWCHNPEGIEYGAELLYNADNCLHCDSCALCGKPCNACGDCVEDCPGVARTVAGKRYSIEELVELCTKDKAFYEKSGGGVTLSGGEVLAREISYVEELCRRLHEDGISIDIDTSGYASYSAFVRLMPYVDCFLFDVKCIDRVLHQKLTGGDNAPILQNLERLSKDGGKIVVRVPVIAELNYHDLFNVPKWLKTHDIVLDAVELIPYHRFGMDKALKLNRVQQSYSVPNKEQLDSLKEAFADWGYRVEN